MAAEKKFKHSPSLFTRIFSKEQLTIPSGWATYHCDEGGVSTLLFSQVTICHAHPVMLRQIVLNADLSLKYFVGSHEVHVTCVYLPSVLKMEADIVSAITAFTSVPICCGLLNASSTLKGATENVFYDRDMFAWRHKLCPYIDINIENSSCKYCQQLVVFG